MTLLSLLRSKFFVHKLTSSINDNSWIDLKPMDSLITQARLGYETMLSALNGEHVDQRRSASRWQIIYRQWVMAPAAIVLALDINTNRQYQWKLLQQINQVINYVVISCEQLWLECIILYYDQWMIKEYTCEWLNTTIDVLNSIIIKNNTINGLWVLIHELHHEYYNHHVIIMSDRYARDTIEDAWQTQNLLDTHQALWYIRDFSSPIIRRWLTPTRLIQLKLQ